MLISRAASAVAVAALLLGCSSMSTETGPFIWSGITWCPTYVHPYGGCNSTRVDPDQVVTFAPSQVSTSSGRLALSLDDAESGAASSYGYAYVDVGQEVSARIWLPCTSSGRVENWPAFWLMGAQPWPTGGEIDIMEGLSGAAWWHYHYQNAAGQKASIGAPVPGDWCGWHTYVVDRQPSRLVFTYDGKTVGTLTAAQTGVPLASGPMYLIIDNGQGIYGGPDVSPAVMLVSSVTIRSS